MRCVVRPQWDGMTVVCIASGPSLIVEDCETVRRSGVPVVVANNVFQVCPWAAALYAHDTKWWRIHHQEVGRIFKGRKFTATQVAGNYGAETTFGLPWFKQFRNSGACAVSLAISGGASRVVLLGFDAAFGESGETHYHGDHPPELSNAASIATWPKQFQILAKYAAEKGVEIVNASRRTALDCFARIDLGQAL